MRLGELPTITQGQTADLKIDAPPIRIWVSRMTVEDGAEFDNAIEIEHHDGESWKTVATLSNPTAAERLARGRWA